MVIDGPEPAPKVVNIPAAPGDRKKPGPKPGSKKKETEDLEFDPFSLFLPVAMDALGKYLLTKRGAHWMPFAAGASDLGEKFAQYLNKKFPAIKAVKYSDEMALAAEIAKLAGPALFIEVMLLMNSPDKPKEVKPNAEQARPSGPASQPSPSDSSQRPVQPVQPESPGPVGGVKDAIPVLI